MKTLVLNNDARVFFYAKQLVYSNLGYSMQPFLILLHQVNQYINVHLKREL